MMHRQFTMMAALAAMLAGCNNGQNGQSAPETFPQEIKDTGFAMGSPGDHWLDTMQFRIVGPGRRDGKPGYEVTYDAPGGATFTLFWSKDEIDFRGTSPGYRLKKMPLGEGQLQYPDRLTAQSLPDVYRAVEIIEYDQLKEAKGAITALEAFLLIATLGPGPKVRVPGPKGPPSPGFPTATATVPKVAKKVAPSSKALERALRAAGYPKPPGWAAHHIVAGSADAARPAREALQRFGIGINDATNGVFLPGTRTAANPTGAAIHSTLHTDVYYRAVNDALAAATTRQEALRVLDDLRQRLLAGGL